MSKVTMPARIISVEDQRSPRYQEYLKALDKIFRNEGSAMLGAIGFICYISLDRPYGVELPYRSSSPQGKIEMNLFVGDDSIDRPNVKDLHEAERKLSETHKGKGWIWKTHLKGQRHDYYFYSFQACKIEDTLNLIEVARVMVS